VLTFKRKSVILFEVMRDMFKFQYNPARHNGEVNHAGEVFDYVGMIVDKFENQTEGEDFSGLTVELYEDEQPTGQTRRFRWDRLIKVVNLANL
jgi:glutamate synthase domain-containing protein 1